LTYCIQTGCLATTSSMHWDLDWNALCEITSHTKSPIMKALQLTD